jgi:hypothetical protein
MRSWLIYGPFNLSGASEAWIDFYFRNASEAGFDFFFWGVSIDGTNFYGTDISGTYTSGPYGNGYNLMRFDLSNVFTLGNLRNKPVVWLAFVFDSDVIITDQGPFIDDVSIVIETNNVFLPLLIKQQAPPPSGALTFRNFTNNPVIVELKNFGTRQFPSTVGPHVWSNIPPGTYQWLASGTCPVGQGQVGSAPPASNRAPITIVNGQTSTLNPENGGKFSCD